MGKDSGIQWKEIPDHEGYFATIDGDIGSSWWRVGLGRGKGSRIEKRDQIRLLKTSTNQNGYKFLNLGRANTKVVHRLILKTFVGPCPSGMEARHLDGNRGNNSLENLAWGTPAENHADQKLHGTRVCGEKHPQSKLGSLHVAAIRDLYSTGTWSQALLASLFGVTQPVVWSIVRKKHRITDPREAI